MGKFLYVARDRKGERIEGALEVEDRQAVIARLQAMGYFPVKIEDVTPKNRFTFNLSFRAVG
jgi:type II secretory pathway component PulF